MAEPPPEGHRWLTSIRALALFGALCTSHAGPGHSLALEPAAAEIGMPLGAQIFAPEADAAFASLAVRLPGRVVQVRAAPPGAGCSGRGHDLLVLSTEGTPPDDERWVSLIACPQPGAAPVARLRHRVPRAVVGVDLVEWNARPGAEILLVSARELVVVGAGPQPDVEPAVVMTRWPLPFALPLPPLTRELRHMPVVDDWNGDGRPTALLPSVDGALLFRLDDGAHRSLPLPIETHYLPADPSPPASEHEWLRTRYQWPTLMRADDDGDGRLDLFAMARFHIWTFRVADEGLPDAPTRTQELRPFAPEHELRWQSSDVGFTAADLDGDGRADLVIDQTRGTLLSSHSTTRIHLGREGGVTIGGPPDGSIELEGGIASSIVADLDGDGRAELFESSVELGVVQLGRLLLTRRASVDFRVHRLAPGGGLETVWSDAVSLRLDFGTGRIDGFFPDVRGDFDGDGRRDLLVPTARGRAGVRLGIAADAGPGFGKVAAELALPIEAGSIWITDADGDGLDDLMLWDSRDLDGALHLLHNRAHLGRSLSPAEGATPRSPDD